MRFFNEIDRISSPKDRARSRSSILGQPPWQVSFTLAMIVQATQVDNTLLLYNLAVMEKAGYKNQEAELDAVFAALADPTRRAILSRLAGGEASVGELTAPFSISQPAVSRHLKVLERAGLVERDIDQQRRPAKLAAETLVVAVDWLAEFREFWGASFHQLDELLIQMKKNDNRGSDK